MICAQWRTEWVIAAVALISLTLSHNSVAGVSSTISPDPTQVLQNSTQKVNEVESLTENAAYAVGVRPPLRAPKPFRRLFMKIEKVMVPLLYRFDPCKPPDSKLALRVLWWKALTASDPRSPVFDDMITYDLQPTMVRVFAGSKLWRRLYPSFARAVVEIRTAYLDRCVTKIVQEARARNPNIKIRFICVGGGYDVRSIKLRERGLIDHAVELDLAVVINAKKRILQRLYRRRPSLLVDGDEHVEFHPVDLNQVASIRSTLEGILRKDETSSDTTHWHCIFLFEGVLMYLDEGVPSALLSICRQVLKNTGQTGSLCFADRLENVPDDASITAGQQELSKHGWNLTDWLPKGGGTKHMGCAEMFGIV